MSDQLASALIASNAYEYSAAEIETPYANHVAKNAIDLTVASLGFLILLPVFLLVAVLVKLDGGPIFFAHQRVGRKGRSFNCYKFRSMRVNSDDLLTNLLLSDPDAAETWEISRKLRHDPRVTRIGKFLRKTSLDELPQLLNVLRMEMSLVGPRPIVDQELSLYGNDVGKYYLFRPGITGQWQVSGRSNTSFSERVRLDVSYAENWSIWLDLQILFKTVPAVFWGRGAR